MDDGAARVAVHFGFNAWGEKFSPWDRDAAVGRLIAERSATRSSRRRSCSRAARSADGAGTILTTEQCLLHPNRNPSLSREQIEQALFASYLGAERVVWLGPGPGRGPRHRRPRRPDRRLHAPGRALLQTVPENPNFDHCEENRERLRRPGSR
jgi:agmatine deiminase